MADIQFDMFRNYDSDSREIPDNRAKCAWGDPDPKDFVYKGTNALTLTILGMRIEYIKSLEFGIHSGIDIAFMKGLDDVSLTELGPDLYIEYVMPASESEQINPEKDLRIQCKITLINDEVIYSPIVKYRVLPVLF